MYYKTAEKRNIWNRLHRTRRMPNVCLFLSR